MDGNVIFRHGESKTSIRGRKIAQSGNIPFFQDMLPYTCCIGNDTGVFIILDVTQRCNCVNGKYTEIHGDLLSSDGLCDRLAGGILKFLCIQPAMLYVSAVVKSCKATKSLLIMIEFKLNTGDHDLQRGAGLSSRINTHNIQILGFTIPHAADCHRVARSHRTRISSVSRSGIHHRCGLLLVIQGIVVIACCGSTELHSGFFFTVTRCGTSTEFQFIARCFILQDLNLIVIANTPSCGLYIAERLIVAFKIFGNI